MGKKKIIGLCLAVGLMVGVVGGSLAWFTDSDTVVNPFSTASETNEDGKSGIIIDEVWNANDAKNILPGTVVNKDVKVKNKATYDQLIRVKFTFKDNSKNKALKDNQVKLNFVDGYESKWTKNVEGDTTWYYFNEKVAANGETTQLLDSVKLLNSAGEEFKNAEFDIVVDAEGVQAANGAVQEVWPNAPKEIKDLGGEFVED